MDQAYQEDQERASQHHADESWQQHEPLQRSGCPSPWVVKKVQLPPMQPIWYADPPAPAGYVQGFIRTAGETQVLIREIPLNVVVAHQGPREPSWLEVRFTRFWEWVLRVDLGLRLGRHGRTLAHIAQLEQGLGIGGNDALVAGPSGARQEAGV